MIMTISKSVVCLLSSSLVCGCGGPFTQQVFGSAPTPAKNNPDACLFHEQQNIFMAKPLCGSYPVEPAPVVTNQPLGKPTYVNVFNVDATNATSPSVGPAFIGAALADSLNKCQDFIAGFTSGVSVENTAFDVLSLGLSALATVFVPANTVRALSGASTISQGTKAAINSDVYQQLTVQLFIQTISNTYFTEYNAFLSDASTLSYAKQFDKIQYFHKDCSIPFAAAAISTSQSKPSTPAVQPIDATKIVNGATFKGGLSGNTYTVTATADTPTPPSGSSPTYTYTYIMTLPSGTKTKAIPTTPDVLTEILNGDHAVAE